MRWLPTLYRKLYRKTSNNCYGEKITELVVDAIDIKDKMDTILQVKEVTYAA